MEFYIEKVYRNMKNLFFYKMCLNVQKGQKWILCTVSEKENVYSVYFLVFNLNIDINRKLLKKSDFWCKIIFFFVKEMVFL